MNITKFNPKEVEHMYDKHKHYNLVLKDGTVIVRAELTYYDESGTFFFDHGGNHIQLNEVESYSNYYKYSIVEVYDCWALTRDGSKFFPENKYGPINDKMYADSLVHMLQYNQDTYTPDTIHVRDIVEFKHPVTPDVVRKAIVVDVIKPEGMEDHGVIEIYFLDNNQYFEHVSYVGWTEFLTVLEEY